MKFDNYQSAKIKKIITKSRPQIAMPVFKDQTFSICDFGAKSGIDNYSTAAIQKAIAYCSSQGGGKVIIPAGFYLSGPIFLLDNVNLHLESGALLKFSSQLADYKIVKSEFEGESGFRFQAPISANGAVNIAITGQGIIDGSGDKWRPVKKFKLTAGQWENLLSSGGAVSKNKNTEIWWPSEAARAGEKLVHKLNSQPKKIDPLLYRQAAEYLRPVLVNFKECKNILLKGVTLENSPAWNIHLLLSKNITLFGLTIRNPWTAQNGDGLDLDSCQNVLVENCNFDVGDDAICLKSGKDKLGQQRNIPTKNVYINSCQVYHGHGGIVVGSEMSGGVNNIYLENCDFIGTDIGIRLKSTRGRGGVVKDIYLTKLRMLNIKQEVLKINLFYEAEAEPEITKKAVSAAPQFKDIFIDSLECQQAGKAVYINGLPEMPVQNVYLSNSQINAVEGIELHYTAGITFTGNNIISQRKELCLSQNKELNLTNYLIVAKDGSGDCCNLNKALKILVKKPSIKKVYLKKGKYQEKVTIPDQINSVDFIGEDTRETIISYADFARKVLADGTELGTDDSATIFINGNQLKFYNISFENAAVPRQEVGQAVAVSITGDQIAFYNCEFKGHQDTLYTKGKGRLFFKNCLIAGDIDFIFGAATAYFKECEIISTGPGYITAASTPKEKKYGYIFKECLLESAAAPDSVFLGRPWRPYAKVVFIDSYLGQHIRQEGWNNWRDSAKEKTAFYAEYNNYGPGANPEKRFDWIKQLTAQEALAYNFRKIFPNWNLINY